MSARASTRGLIFFQLQPTNCLNLKFAGSKIVKGVTDKLPVPTEKAPQASSSQLHTGSNSVTVVATITGAPPVNGEQAPQVQPKESATGARTASDSSSESMMMEMKVSALEAASAANGQGKPIVILISRILTPKVLEKMFSLVQGLQTQLSSIAASSMQHRNTGLHAQFLY